jgi:hypothetical protein
MLGKNQKPKGANLGFLSIEKSFNSKVYSKDWSIYHGPSSDFTPFSPI